MPPSTPPSQSPPRALTPDSARRTSVQAASRQRLDIGRQARSFPANLTQDGKTVGRAFDRVSDYGPARPGSLYDNLRIDQHGLWARYFGEVSGTGRDYPLAPGEFVVIATDAMDHRPCARTPIDLTNADFEFRGSADADNPSVPDMVNVGLAEYAQGRGLYFGPAPVAFIADATDVAQLPRNPNRIPGGSTCDSPPSKSSML